MGMFGAGALLGGYVVTKVASSAIPAMESTSANRFQKADGDLVDMKKANKYGEFNTHFWQRDALNRHERIKVKNAAEGSQKLVLPPTAAEIKESWRVQFKEADKDMSGELSREEAAAIGIDQGTFDALDTD